MSSPTAPNAPISSPCCAPIGIPRRSMPRIGAHCQPVYAVSGFAERICPDHAATLQVDHGKVASQQIRT